VFKLGKPKTAGQWIGHIVLVFVALFLGLVDAASVRFLIDWRLKASLQAQSFRADFRSA
jgi:hypothetical protein